MAKATRRRARPVKAQLVKTASRVAAAVVVAVAAAATVVMARVASSARA